MNLPINWFDNRISGAKIKQDILAGFGYNHTGIAPILG